MKSHFLPLFLGSLLLLASSAQGVVLVSYEFTEPLLADINKPTTVADDASASLAT